MFQTANLKPQFWFPYREILFELLKNGLSELKLTLYHLNGLI